MRITRTHFAGVELEIRQSGIQLELLGFYSEFPSVKSEADAIVEIRVTEGFEQGRSMSAGHPGFDCTQTGAESFLFSRFGSEGEVDLQAGDIVRGSFECANSPNEVEAAIRVVASITLPRHGALILHSSAIADKRGAQVFSGVSGAGKSTIATMLDSTFPVQKISDELLLAYKNEGLWTVAVSPFVGSGGLLHGSHRPLLAINLLKQWPSHIRSEVSKAAAMGELCKHVLTYTQGSYGFQGVLDLVADLVTEVPCFQLQFKKEPSVSEVLGITC